MEPPPRIYNHYFKIKCSKTMIETRHERDIHKEEATSILRNVANPNPYVTQAMSTHPDNMIYVYGEHGSNCDRELFFNDYEDSNAPLIYFNLDTNTYGYYTSIIGNENTIVKFNELLEKFPQQFASLMTEFLNTDICFARRILYIKNDNHLNFYIYTPCNCSREKLIEFLTFFHHHHIHDVSQVIASIKTQFMVIFVGVSMSKDDIQPKVMLQLF